MWHYVRSEPQLWTVGCGEPGKNWTPDSDHDSSESAAKRVAFLNGGDAKPTPETENWADYLAMAKGKSIEAEAGSYNDSRDAIDYAIMYATIAQAESMAQVVSLLKRIADSLHAQVSLAYGAPPSPVDYDAGLISPGDVVQKWAVGDDHRELGIFGE